MAGVEVGVAIEGEESFHHACPNFLERGRPGFSLAADRAAKQGVGGEAVPAVDYEGDLASRVAAEMDDLDAHAGDLQPLAIVDQAIHHREGGRGEAMGDNCCAESFAHAFDFDDMVVVLVRDEDVRDRHLVAIGCLQQRVQALVQVDQEALSAGLVGDQVSVREPAFIRGALEHRHATWVTGAQAAQRSCSGMSASPARSARWRSERAFLSWPGIEWLYS